MENKAKEEILYMDFNQDKSHFAIGTQNGFYIYNIDNGKNSYQELGGGIGIIEMNYKTNIIALVGGGKNPKYPVNKVMLWDDHTKKCSGELTFLSEIKGVKLRKEKFSVILENKIYVYEFNQLKFLESAVTCPNPRGLCAMDYNDICNFYVCPDKEIGKVLYVKFDDNKQYKINAHESALGVLEVSKDGNYLATASEKGTIIRLVNLKEKKIIKQLRRGIENALIYS